jgi:His-Xaa-Ser system protein HxsD
MNTSFSINIDRQIYDTAAISKAIYWHTADFVISRNVNNSTEIITFQSKKSELSETEKESIMQKFNQDLNDYKLRQIIEQETNDIRTILYVKAFANNDEFEEYE